MKKFSRVFTVVVFIFLYIPMIALAVASFNTGKDIAVFEGFTLAQYAELFRDDTLLALLGNSVIISVLSTAVAVTSAAELSSRVTVKWKRPEVNVLLSLLDSVENQQ